MDPVSDSLVKISLEEALSKYKAVYKMIAAQPFGSLYADLASYLLNLPVQELQEVADAVKIKGIGKWTVHRLKEELDAAIERRLSRGLNDAIRLDSQRLLELIHQNEQPFIEGHPRHQAYDQESFETWSKFFKHWGKIFYKRNDGSDFEVEELHSYVIELRAFYKAFNNFTEYIDKWPLPPSGVYPWYDETFGRHLANFAVPDSRPLTYLQEELMKGSARQIADSCVRQYQKLIEVRTEFFEGLRQLCDQEIDSLLRWKTADQRAGCREVVASVLVPQRHITEEIIEKLKNLKTSMAWKNYSRIDEKAVRVRQMLQFLTIDCSKCKEELRVALGKYFAEMHNKELKRLQLLKQKTEESLGMARAVIGGVSVSSRQQVEKLIGQMRNVYYIWEDFIGHVNLILRTETKKYLRVVYNWPEVEEYFNNVGSEVRNIVQTDQKDRDWLGMPRI